MNLFEKKIPIQLECKTIAATNAKQFLCEGVRNCRGKEITPIARALIDRPMVRAKESIVEPYR